VKLLTLARDLKRRRGRERDGSFVTEGVRAVEELLASSLNIRGVLVTTHLADAPRGAALLAALHEAAPQRGFAVSEVSDRDFAGAADTESPQGILAIARTPERSFGTIVLEAGARLLVLDGLQDPGNVGTILRTAAALGVAATVALPGTVDLWNAKVVRGAMGAHFRHHAFGASLDDLASYLERYSVTLWSTSAGGKSLDEMTDPLPDRLAIAVGNEGAGISDALAAMAAMSVALPIREVESLNVAVATGMVLYALRPPRET
jgi:TrmH family RNA methyltransferase